jgi:predicted HTH domain antitoxin
MQTLGIKDLQVNPSSLTKALEAREYTVITKHSNPIGVAIAFDETILTEGVQRSLLIDAYKNGQISLGQFAKGINLSKDKAMKLLSIMGIDVIVYDFNDDLKTIDNLL